MKAFFIERRKEEDSLREEEKSKTDYKVIMPRQQGTVLGYLPRIDI